MRFELFVILLFYSNNCLAIYPKEESFIACFQTLKLSLIYLASIGWDKAANYQPVLAKLIQYLTAKR